MHPILSSESKLDVQIQFISPSCLSSKWAHSEKAFWLIWKDNYVLLFYWGANAPSIFHFKKQFDKNPLFSSFSQRNKSALAQPWWLRLLVCQSITNWDLKGKVVGSNPLYNEIVFISMIAGTKSNNLSQNQRELTSENK